MNPDVQARFEQARELVQRAQNYEKQGNYEFASRCYVKVTKVLLYLKQNASKKQSADQIEKKIRKYSDLAAQMLDKQQQKGAKKAKISKFGFPTTTNNTSNMTFMPTSNLQIQKKQQSIKMNTSNRNTLRQTQKMDEDVQNVVCTDIKVGFQDIVGMDDVKEILYESVIFPQKRPDLFEGIRSPPRGILLYGPPGNGKTFIVKALAKQSGCVFYGLSAGSILNKFVGETQKMLRKIFESAKNTAPSIIFIDQIDSILTARAQNQSDSTRRLKTQFLVQFDSLEADSKVILIGATNFPNQLDLAALRRFNKLVYIGLPSKQARQGIIQRALKELKYDFSKTQMKNLVKDLDGYTASQITDIVKQASMYPLRQLTKKQMQTVQKNKIRPVKYQDFVKIIKQRRPLLTKQDLKKFQGKFK